MAAFLSALAIMILGLTESGGNDICSFNRLCTCRKSHHEVICRGVPFSKFPSLSTGTIYQVYLTAPLYTFARGFITDHLAQINPFLSPPPSVLHGGTK
ncbi:hypothetical protein CEXT_619151 [Caerostris extrusa]|uniref:Secreted protein n=1 Tax=Caerostris extrusa TaxID=172846 RepID=A0AAV4Y1N2_CAEEX|nr:hypothetical protein CEXT_619151 [Caerostris extrusa]